MSRRSLITGVLLFLAGLVGFGAGTVPSGTAQESTPAGAATPQLKTLDEKASYAIGLNIGKSILSDELAVSPELVAKGVTDALKKSKPLLTEAEIKECMTEFTKQVQAKAAAKQVAATGKNTKEGQEYLATNKAKKDVVTTDTGLQYQVIKAGKGESPKKTDVVRVHYHGTLIDGKVFDSSVERKEPAEFPVNRVIPGWTEALQKMKVGDKWQLVIPSELAYGERGTPGGPIGPNAVLVFDVELLEIVK